MIKNYFPTKNFSAYLGKQKNLLRNRIFIRKFQNNIRNVGVVAHIDAGKTTTSEQMLFICGATKSIGRVDSGDTVMDFLPEERERGITISSAAISFKWRDSHINLIDTPGHVDFTIEVERAVRVLDGVIVIVDAVAGVQAQTRTVWNQTRKQNIPAIAFVNKMDRSGANFERSCDSLQNSLDINILPIQCSIGEEETFTGVIDLISMTKSTWNDEVVSSSSSSSSSRKYQCPTVEPILPSDSLYERAYSCRQQMLDTLAEVDEVFMDYYLNNDPQSIGTTELVAAIRRSCLLGLITPALCGASLRGKGVELLLNSVSAFLPSPYDRPPVKAAQKKAGVSATTGGATANVTVGTDVKTILVPPTSKDLCALAFKVVQDKERGQLVYVRIYSGVLHSKQVIRNSTRNLKERINQLLMVSADDYEQISEIAAGHVGCIVGLRETASGDTLVDDKGPLHTYCLAGLDIPPPVYSISIEPDRTSKQAALDDALNIIKLEDPSVVVKKDEESGQTILCGLGELHLEIICNRLLRQFGIEVSTGRAYIAFRESVDVSMGVISREHRFDRMLGPKRIFASLCLEIEAVDDISAPVVVIEKAVVSMLSADEYNSLADGLHSSFSRGPHGYPVVGLRVTVTGVERDMDTTAGALRACAAACIHEVLSSQNKIMLEPVMSFEADVPTRAVGDILTDLAVKRRGIILDSVSSEVKTTITATVPFVNMLGYATTFRSMTQGEGSFTMEYQKHSSVDVSMVQGHL